MVKIEALVRVAREMDDDAVVRAAQREMVHAAQAVQDAKTRLRAALASLEAHPDYQQTKLALRKRPERTTEEAVTAAWWVHGCIQSVLEDAPFDLTDRFLFEDGAPPSTLAALRQFIATERRDMAGRRRCRAPKGKPAVSAAAAA